MMVGANVSLGNSDKDLRERAKQMAKQFNECAFMEEVEDLALQHLAAVVHIERRKGK